MNPAHALNQAQPAPARAGSAALVIGGSLAGLLAGRVLSDYFERITILEKDPIQDRPESRRGQPQTRHGHGLLAHGLDILETLFPGLTDELVADGAIAADMGQAIRWYQYGGYRRQFASGLQGIVCSRPFLEWKTRRRVLGLPNVDIRGGARVERLIPNADGSRVAGLQVRDRMNGSSSQRLDADLIIDASGRGTRTPRWLAHMGFEPPPEEEVRVDLTYVSRIYRRRESDAVQGKLVMLLPTPPDDKRLAFLLPIEHDRWILTAGGWHGHHPALDERALIRFLRDLPASDIFDVLRDAEPLTDIVIHKFPCSRRLRFEKLSRFPNGFLVIGDALASFTPVYAQGMTSAAMQANALDTLLKGRRGLRGLWRPYFREMARLVDRLWQLAVSEDFRFPETQGKKPFATDLINRYVGRVHKATHTDTVVYGQFLRVMNLLAPVSSLMHPRILWRVLGRTRRQESGIDVGTRSDGLYVLKERP